MTIEQLVGFMALAVIILFVYGPWQYFCVDRARARLFRLRESLFDLAVRGQISFDADVYKSAERHINFMLRGAHRYTWVRLLFLGIAAKGITENPNIWTLLKEHKHDGYAADVAALLQSGYEQLSALMVLRSPLLMLCFLVFVVLRVVAPLDRARDYFSWFIRTRNVVGERIEMRRRAPSI